MNKPVVQVLMSTYNGEKYLEQQIDSILNQDGVQIKLLVRDDCSDDGTVEILQRYSDAGKLEFYHDVNLGPAQSFLDLVSKAQGADYYSFSDQDDEWDANKLISAINILRNEREDIPLLYHSNLRVVDRDLKFNRFAHDRYIQTQDKYSALTEAAVTGCTMVMNQALIDKLHNRMPDDCSMHDSWVYMVCMMFGRVIYDDKAYMSYRQHGNNVHGAYQGKKDLSLYWHKAIDVLTDKAEARYRNAKSFLKCYEDILPEKDKEKLREIVEYKDSILKTAKLLFDFDMHTSRPSREIRYRVGILLRQV